MQEDKIILYIEDDPEARYLMADIIRYKGYIYIEASRGLEGIRLAEQHCPDLILMDLVLPDMQGYEITTHLKNLPKLATTPIVAVTAETQRNVRELVLTAGCDGYITKPINVSEFIFKIEEFLSGHKEQMSPEEERIYLQQYNIQLVNRLKKKIGELERMNESLSELNSELFTSREELTNYNDRLFYLNNLANYLRTLNNPLAILRVLPARVAEGFQISRCIIFERHPADERMTPRFTAGIALSDAEKIKSILSETFINTLHDQGGILWVKDDAEIIDPSLQKFSRQLDSSNFILANLSQLGNRELPASEAELLGAAEQQSQYFIFMDQHKRNTGLQTYQVRILKSLIQTVAVIHENIRLQAQLMDLYKIKSEQAIRDELTQIYNYRYFKEELEREINRSDRFKTHFSLLMLDIDFFKQYNDSFGHLAGDQLLKQLSELLQQNIRTTDTISRYGGEEFTIIMPGLEKSAAYQIAEKLRVLVAEYAFSFNEKAVGRTVTISIGLASYPEDATDPQELVRIADTALYKAKRAGRNKVLPG